jgi:hypothetical protein
VNSKLICSCARCKREEQSRKSISVPAPSSLSASRQGNVLRKRSSPSGACREVNQEVAQLQFRISLSSETSDHLLETYMEAWGFIIILVFPHFQILFTILGTRVQSTAWNSRFSPEPRSSSQVTSHGGGSGCRGFIF